MFEKKFRFVFIAGLVAAAALSQAATYGLCIGINDYPDVKDSEGKPVLDKDGKPQDDDLRGAVNDAKAIRDALVKKFGVPEANVKIYLDKQADEKGFIDGLVWLLKTAKPGDQVVFSYSGHGSQIASTDPNEEDKLDEVLVLSDGKLVPDGIFADVAKALKTNGVHATFIFDSCFSGGMSRQGARLKNLNLKNRSGFKRVADTTLSRVKSTVKPVAKPRGDEQGKTAFLFAGQENQPTIDISGLKDIPAHGLFTLFLTAALEDAPTASVADLVETAASFIKKLEFDQKPRAEFSDADRAAKPLVLK